MNGPEDDLEALLRDLNRQGEIIMEQVAGYDAEALMREIAAYDTDALIREVLEGSPPAV